MTAENQTPAPVVRQWRHARKGLITGTLVSTSADGEWLNIRLATDHELRYMAASNRGRVDEEGDVLTARASLLTEVEVKA